MIGHNYNLKVANPSLRNDKVPAMISNAMQPPFYTPQSFTPMDLGKAAFHYQSPKK